MQSPLWVVRPPLKIVLLVCTCSYHNAPNLVLPKALFTTVSLHRSNSSRFTYVLDSISEPSALSMPRLSDRRLSDTLVLKNRFGWSNKEGTYR
jgi:hypothetical protein